MPRRTEPSPFSAKVGVRIRALRTGRNMSLSDLSDASAISKGHLSSIEHGLAAITIETVNRIATGLGMPPMYLLTFPEDDLTCRIVEQVRDQQPAELRKLKKELDARYPAAKAAKGTKPAKAAKR